MTGRDPKNRDTAKPCTLMELVNDFIVQESMAETCRSMKPESLFSKDNLSRIVIKTEINKLNHYGHTALSTAVFAGSLQCCRILLRLGADPNMRDVDGWTSLHFAVARNFFGIARYLISSGANVSVMNRDGETALDFIESKDLKRLLLTTKGSDLKRSRSLPYIDSKMNTPRIRVCRTLVNSTINR